VPGGGWVWGAIETYCRPSDVLANVIDARPLMVLPEFGPSPTILNSVIATTASLPAGIASLMVIVSCPPTFLNSLTGAVAALGYLNATAIQTVIIDYCGG